MWVDVVHLTQKALFYRSIVYIMQRQEFGLEGVLSKDGRPQGGRDEVIRRYRKLIIQSFEHAVRKVRDLYCFLLSFMYFISRSTFLMQQ